MAPFTISEAAIREIQRKFEFSALEQPIASLLDCSSSFPTSAEMVDCLSRAASKEELLALAKREYEERKPTLKMHLAVGIYDTADVPPEYRAEIAGFPFSMAKAMLDRLADHVLDHDGQAFVLRYKQRVFPSLSQWSAELE